jgi:hypothetical protein
MGMGNPLRDQELFEKIRALPEEKVAEIEDFVDLLIRDRTVTASGEARGFLRLAGTVSGPEDLSRRKGFSRS